MPLVDSYSPGTFCWVDLATSDAAAAKGFYTEVFGWDAKDVPAGPGGVYTMLEQAGKSVAGLFQMSPEMSSAGAHPHWQNYVSVDDADAAVAKAEGLGAKVLSPAFDVMDAGRMAMIQDPTGAHFAVWQPQRQRGAQLVNEPNSLCWNELQTTDLGVAERFYHDLFGWEAKHGQGAAAQTYVEFRNGERGAAGMLRIQPEWGEVPPNWMVYFAVADLDATLGKIKELGGNAEVPPMQIPGVGRFAVVQDAQKAAFAMIQMEEGVVEP